MQVKLVSYEIQSIFVTLTLERLFTVSPVVALAKQRNFCCIWLSVNNYKLVKIFVLYH